LETVEGDGEKIDVGRGGGRDVGQGPYRGGQTCQEWSHECPSSSVLLQIHPSLQGVRDRIAPLVHAEALAADGNGHTRVGGGRETSRWDGGGGGEGTPAPSPPSSASVQAPIGKGTGMGTLGGGRLGFNGGESESNGRVTAVASSTISAAPMLNAAVMAARAKIATATGPEGGSSMHATRSSSRLVHVGGGGRREREESDKPPSKPASPATSRYRSSERERGNRRSSERNGSRRQGGGPAGSSSRRPQVEEDDRYQPRSRSRSRSASPYRRSRRSSRRSQERGGSYRRY
jgi:hypothetical protein